MQKYSRGQKVRIVTATNQFGAPKYPEIRKHLSRTGTVFAGYWVHNRLPRIASDQYIYEIVLDDDSSKLTVPEDALAAEFGRKSQASRSYRAL